MKHSTQDITGLLLAWHDGDMQAHARLTEITYQELKRIARRFISREREGHPFQPTDLLHEVYLRLIDASRVDWQNRAQFFAIAARTMRQVLVDLARSRKSLKNGGRLQQVTLNPSVIVSPERDIDFIVLDEAVNQLAAAYPRQAKVVELRYFGGLTVKEAAEVLGVAERTVEADWTFAKSWLIRNLSGNRDDPGAGEHCATRPN